jgi:hypothetical protein
VNQSAPRRSKSRTNTVRTLLVVAAFVLLLAYMLLFEARRAPPPAPDATPTPRPLLSWKMEDLRSIHVTDGSRVTHVQRVGADWRVVEPADAAGQSPSEADPHTLYWPLLELAGLEARLLVSEKVVDKAAYGLDTPSLTIKVEAEPGERERLYAGRETPDGTAFYVQLEGDPRLYIVDHFKIELFQEWLSAPPFKATPAPEG